MPIPSCRGLPARRRIVANYKLVPIAHVALLSGQEKQNAAGGVLTDRYYAFEYEEVVRPANRGVFFCGYVCGESFCDLLGIAHLTQFDPLRPVPAIAGVGARLPVGAGGAGAVVVGAAGHAPAMDPLNLELYQAINLHVVLSNTPPHGGYGATLEYIRKNPTRRTRPEYVVRFNNYLMKAYGGATLLSKCAAIPGIKTFSFPEIAAVLIAEGVHNYYE